MSNRSQLTRHLYSKYFSCYFVFHFLAARVFRRQKQLQLTQFHLYCCTSASFISCVWHPLSTILLPPQPTVLSLTLTVPLRYTSPTVFPPTISMRHNCQRQTYKLSSSDNQNQLLFICSYRFWNLSSCNYETVVVQSNFFTHLKLIL